MNDYGNIVTSKYFSFKVTKLIFFLMLVLQHFYKTGTLCSMQFHIEQQWQHLTILQRQNVSDRIGFWTEVCLHNDAIGERLVQTTG